MVIPKGFEQQSFPIGQGKLYLAQEVNLIKYWHEKSH